MQYDSSTEWPCLMPCSCYLCVVLRRELGQLIDKSLVIKMGNFASVGDPRIVRLHMSRKRIKDGHSRVCQQLSFCSIAALFTQVSRRIKSIKINREDLAARCGSITDESL